MSVSHFQAPDWSVFIDPALSLVDSDNLTKSALDTNYDTWCQAELEMELILNEIQKHIKMGD